MVLLFSVWLLLTFVMAGKSPLWKDWAASPQNITPSNQLWQPQEAASVASVPQEWWCSSTASSKNTQMQQSWSWTTSLMETSAGALGTDQSWMLWSSLPVMLILQARLTTWLRILRTSNSARGQEIDALGSVHMQPPARMEPLLGISLKL